MNKNLLSIDQEELEAVETLNSTVANVNRNWKFYSFVGNKHSK